MNDTSYLPADWLDEDIPDTVADPNAFLHCDEGKWFIRPSEDGTEREHPEFWHELQPGMVLTFCEHQCFGFWPITIRRHDGKAQYTGGENIPTIANCFCDEDNEHFSDTLGECIASLLAYEPERSGEVSIHAYVWTDGWPWLFDVINGKGVLTKMEANHVVH